MRQLVRLIALATIAVVASIPVSPVSAEGYPTIDGQFSGVGAIGPNGVLNLTVTGRSGVPPTGVDAVAVNVAVTNPTVPSFLTIFPKGAPRPLAANLNFEAGQTIPNMVIAKVGADGQISIYNLAGTVDVIVDVLGWFPTGGSYTGLTPARLLETRAGLPTIDGQSAGVGAIGPNGVLNLTVTGRGGVPPTGVDAVAVNVAVTNPTVPSFLTIFPKGAPRPLAANLNFEAGQTIPNMVIAKVGADGQISIYNLAGTVDVIVDVLGWFPTGGSYTGLTPARLLETRAGLPTIDGQSAGVGAIGPNGVLNLTVTGRSGVPPTGVDAVAVNVAVTNPTVPSFLTIFPKGAPRPLAANLNFEAGQTIPNMVIAKVGADGQISIYNLAGTVDVIVDVLGWFPTGGSYTGLTPARLLDTRSLPAPPTTPPTTPTPPTAPPVLAFSAGTYVVGTQIPAGRYVAENAKSGCYWERQSGFGGTVAEIIANDFQGFTGRSIVDIKSSDVGFEFDADCGQFKTYVAATSPVGVIGPGTHHVGAHIIPGTYTATVASGCYWERLKGFSGNIADVISNDFIGSAGNEIVTISATDVGFHSDGDCGTWMKVG